MTDGENRFDAEKADELPAQSAFVLTPWVKFIGVVLAPALAVLFGFGAREIVLERLAGTGWDDLALFAFALAALAGLALFMLFAMAWVLRARLTLDHQGIVLRGAFGARSIPWAKIEGFRWTAGRLFVFPAEDRWPLNLSYFGNQGLLFAWLHAHLPDLQQADLAKEAQEIRADHSLGLMEKEKAARLGALRRILKPINWAGYVAAAIGGANALFLGLGQVQLVTGYVLVAVPVVLFLIALRFRDQVRLDYREGSLYPEGATGILASGVAIGLISLLDHHTTLGERLAELTFALAAGTALLWLHLEWRRIQAQRRWMFIALHVASIGFVSGFWAGGSVYQINKNADASEAVWDTTRVTGLRKSQERTGTSYHATVAPWRASPEPVELDISGETYDSLRAGASVDISVRRGALEIPWVDEVRMKKQSR